MTQKLDVRMNGKQYLEYLRYKNRKPLSRHVKSGLMVMGLFFSVAAVLGFVAAELHSSLRRVSEPMEYVEFFGVPIMVVAPTVLLIAAAVGWIVHGVGFALVRR